MVIFDVSDEISLSFKITTSSLLSLLFWDLHPQRSWILIIVVVLEVLLQKVGENEERRIKVVRERRKMI